MVNKRFLQTAERWKNPSLPAERVQPVAPIQQSSPLINNVNYSFLEGDFGKEIHEEIVREYGADNPFVTKEINYTDGIIRGSKPGYVIAVNKALQSRGLRIVTSTDVQKIINQGVLDLSGKYEDLGLVLYSEDAENEYLAKDLATQIRQRVNLQFPTLLPLVGLELRVDNNAPENLAFQLTNISQIIHALQLDNSNNKKKFSDVDEKGLPIFDKKGTRTLYTREGGLRRLFRDWDLDLSARVTVLAFSNEIGRVIVCREATCTKK